MQVVEIEDKLASKAAEIARSENKTLSEFVNLSVWEALSRKRRHRSDEEKVERFAESYREFPQHPGEYEIWQDEQVWEEE
jgi:hypothetical protein